MRKHKVDSLVNLIGLAIGAACFLLIIRYVQFEYSYDSFITNHSQICRVVTDVPEQNGGVMRSCMSSGAFTRLLDDNFPEVIVSTRCTPSFETLIEIDGRQYYESNTWYADSTFLQVFKFPLVKGDPEDALSGSMKVVISEKIAKKYFGNEDPVNKQIEWGSGWIYTVSGVIKDLPDNMHFDIDFLATPDSLRNFQPGSFWGSMNLFSYVLLEENTNRTDLEQKFYDFTVDRMGENWANIMLFKLQNIDDIHLHSDRLHEVAKTTDGNQLVYLLLVAFLIIILALVNFMNLYTARSEYRSKEVGIRKVVGGKRRQLILQFLTEVLVYSSIAVIIALFILRIVWPYFIDFIEINIPFKLLDYLIYVVFFIIFCAFLTGLYPSLYLSSFNPISSIKSLFRLGKRSTLTRKLLVVIQIGLAVFMIIATIVIEMQMKYIRKKDLGFNKDHIITLSVRSNIGQDLDKTRKEFGSIPGMKGVAVSSAQLGNILSGQRSYYLPSENRDNGTADFMLRTVTIDQNYIPLLDIQILEGRNFSEIFGSDPAEAIIANEAAVKRLGLNNPVGERLCTRTREDSVINYHIVGVVQDFHYQSLHSEVEPLLFRFSTSDLYILSLKIDGLNIQETIRGIEEKWAEHVPDFPFQYEFLDEELGNLYDTEKKLSKIYKGLTLLTIFIACLGLFGITSFMLEKRTKEIGIRKVMGAMPLNILQILSKDLVVWLVIANIISWPLSYIFISKWLQSFAFHVKIYWWLFPLTLLLISLIAFFTISFNTYKAATQNPVNSLRYE